MTFAVYTLGCRVNQYESAAIAEALIGRGATMLSPEDICDAYIINTCTVTAESDRKARQFIRRAVKKNPNAYILVTGCYAQREADKISRIEGVDYICGSRNKNSVVDALFSLEKSGKKNAQAEILPCELEKHGFEPMSISSFERTRAYVKIEDGCENRCAYCVIPSVRGKVTSKPHDAVLNEVSALAKSGYREVVLTGIETSSYGKDIGDDLVSLVRDVDKIEGIERIRFGSLDPVSANARFADEISSLSHVCHHFHLSLQSGCDATLARMRRKYNTQTVRKNIEYLRKKMPDVCFSADIIVGFPGESEEEFSQTLEFLKEINLLHAHVFCYSKRPGTEAQSMPCQIDEETKKKRNRIISQACEESKYSIIRENMGKVMPVLFESTENGYATGHTDNFIEVKAKCGENVRGKTLDCEIFEIADGTAIAKILNK